ncbi:MAG: protease modulator HflC [Proteobacteria bacterium]|uniref:Protein HflC n=1 Tax=SAR86 cluster bacterium TaxID=2030880 RepID=A0A937IC85_9GAMM|nr:protease modulator HflC [SAR86 cluster bacterium]MBL6819831.1 protease modulator HflC [SAR86 cluster bacterium]MDA0344928.1 protease modulator HflC [Pseudomonadota bacterium]MDA0899843.1 protease modulator HflC [Pseudomonadota bacterium]
MNKGNFVLFVALLLLIVGVQSIVVVKDTEKAILLKLGAFERTLSPGLNFKVPLMDTAIKFEGRLRTLDTQPDRVLSSESKPLLVDSFVKYKIVDAETFYTSTNGGQDRVAEDTLQRRVRDKLRNEFGKRTLQEVVSGDRDGLMESLKNSLGEDSSELGVEIVDFRVKRIDFEREIRASVFERMKTERNRIAEELRAEGRELAENIRADADRQRTIILANATRESERIRGEGDAIATATYANAFNKDPEFYDFTRSLKAYRETFKDKGDILLLDPDSDYFKYLNKSERQ